MKSCKEIFEESAIQKYRFTVYKVDGRGMSKFVESINHNELDGFMNDKKNINKYGTLLVVTNDGKWILYREEDGKFIIESKGKDVMKEWKDKLDKKPDLDSK